MTRTAGVVSLASRFQGMKKKEKKKKKKKENGG